MLWASSIENSVCIVKSINDTHSPNYDLFPLKIKLAESIHMEQGDIWMLLMMEVI